MKRLLTLILLASITLFAQNVPSSAWETLYDLNVDIIPAFKDTKMIVPNLVEAADDDGWNMKTDESYIKSDGSTWTNLNNYGYDKRFYITMRCWAIVAEMINHKYGGDLTQDEITFYGNTKQSGDSIIGAFRINKGNGAYGDTEAKTLSWALNGVKVTHYNKTLTTVYDDDQTTNYPITTELKDKVLEILAEGHPVMTQINGHIELIDAAYKDENGRTIVRILNGINTDYKPKYVFFEDENILSVYDYETPTSVRMTNNICSVYKDSDGDGLVDFDECYRFHTLPYDKDKDSDNDGVDDYHEVYSYFHRINTLYNKEFSANIEDSFLILDNFESLAYKLKTLFPNGRPEINPDSDGDGLRDGEEDKNGNGIVDEGETDPLNPFDGKYIPNTNYDVPENFVLYAMNKLTVNDRVKCIGAEKGQDKRCHAGCEGMNQTDNINIGVDASLNDIYSKGGVILRSRASVGTVRIYGNPENYFYMDTQKDASSQAYLMNINPKNWYWFVNTNLSDYSTGTTEITVKNGETYTLTEGQNIKKIRVERGGTLDIGTGVVYIGDIQMDAGSFFTKSNHDKASVIHLNGYFEWRASIVIPEAKYLTAHNYLSMIAKSIKIIQHNNTSMFVEGDWAGTIFAPYSKVVLGQTIKQVYGRFLAYDLTVHQTTEVHEILFEGKGLSTLQKKGNDEFNSVITQNSVGKDSHSIKGITRNTISFEVKNQSLTTIQIIKDNGKVLKSIKVNPTNIGLNTISWDSYNLPKGRYVLTLQNGSNICGRVFVLK